MCKIEDLIEAASKRLVNMWYYNWTQNCHPKLIIFWMLSQFPIIFTPIKTTSFSDDGWMIHQVELLPFLNNSRTIWNNVQSQDLLPNSVSYETWYGYEIQANAKPASNRSTIAVLINAFCILINISVSIELRRSSYMFTKTNWVILSPFHFMM